MCAEESVTQKQTYSKKTQEAGYVVLIIIPTSPITWRRTFLVTNVRNIPPIVARNNHNTLLAPCRCNNIIVDHEDGLFKHRWVVGKINISVAFIMNGASISVCVNLFPNYSVITIRILLHCNFIFLSKNSTSLPLEWKGNEMLFVFNNVHFKLRLKSIFGATVN